VTPGGALVGVVGAGQAPAVAALFAAAGFFAVDRVADLAGIERVVGGTAVPAAAVRVASS
jgi:methylase of polypeptide subunit release factors